MLFILLMKREQARFKRGLSKSTGTQSTSILINSHLCYTYGVVLGSDLGGASCDRSLCAPWALTDPEGTPQAGRLGTNSVLVVP